MLHSTDRQKKLDLLLICLNSLDLYYNDKIENYINHKIYAKHTKKTYRWLQNLILNYAQLINIVHITNQITLEKSNKEKIVSILLEYSSKNYINHKRLSLITRQYLTRFYYQYDSNYAYTRYKYKDTYHINNKDINTLAIKNLYLIYKTLSTQSIYFLYDYLKSY